MGAVVLAPLSEMYGRKPVGIISLLLFSLLIIPCGIGNSMTELLIVRFFGAVAGSAMVSSAPGSVADIVDDEHRALAFSIWSIGPLNGPGMRPVQRRYCWRTSNNCSDSVWSDYWRICHTIPGMEMDQLDHLDDVRSCPYIRVYNGRNLFACSFAKEGREVAKGNG